MAELFQTCFILTVVLWFSVLSTSSAAFNFNWCYFFNGDCLARCPYNRQPLGTYSNLAIRHMLCGNSGWCCPKSYYEPPAPKRAVETTMTTSTTTTTTTTTTEPTTTTTTTTEPTTTRQPSTTRSVSVPACGLRGLSRKIIGGVQAQYCEFQYMAYIHLESSPCGGAIIDDRHIITAAHCLWDLNGLQPEVVIGEYNRSRFEPNFEFKTKNYRKFLNGAYNSITYENDIAIIKLREPIDFSQFRCLRPICRPDRNLKFPVNTLCTVTGWGVTSPIYDIFRPPLSDVLLKVQLPIVDHSVCRNIYHQQYYSQTNICAGDLSGRRDSCGGDSGGPLICTYEDRDYMAGIVSAGSGCAEPGKAAIYTDVGQYDDWIENVIKMQ